MGMCRKCHKGVGWLVLILGILFLIADLTAWNFWGIQWWTLAFIVWGLCSIGMACCKECMSCCSTGGDMKDAKKKK